MHREVNPRRAARADFINLILTSVLVLCAVVLTGFHVAARMNGPRILNTVTSTEVVRAVANAAEYHQGGHIIGEPVARDTITVFSDYECSACAALWSNIKASDAFRDGRIAVRYRELPLLRIHPFARNAAALARCAAQHDKYIEAHDALLTRVQPASTAAVDFARYLQIEDGNAFMSCVNGTDVNAAIDADMLAANRVGANGTPSILVGDSLIVGVVSVERLNSIPASGR